MSTIEEMQEVEMYVLCSPDGSMQISTLAPDFEFCVGFCMLLAKNGLATPIEQLLVEGYAILPVKVTITQNGDVTTPFKKRVNNENTR